MRDKSFVPKIVMAERTRAQKLDPSSSPCPSPTSTSSSSSSSTSSSSDESQRCEISGKCFKASYCPEGDENFRTGADCKNDSKTNPALLRTVTVTRTQTTTCLQTAEGTQMRTRTTTFSHESTLTDPSMKSFEMWVPMPRVGLILGEEGETVKAIEKSTGTTIVIEDSVDWRNSNGSVLCLPTQLLRITGPPDGLERAQAKVEEILHGGVEVWVKGDKVELFKKGGAAVRAIQDSTGAKVALFQEPVDWKDWEEEEFLPMKLLTISGPPDSVARAESQIEEIMDYLEIEIQVKMDSHLELFKTEGAAVKSIQDSTGAKIALIKEPEDGREGSSKPFSKLRISGHWHSVYTAKSLVDKLLDQ